MKLSFAIEGEEELKSRLNALDKHLSDQVVEKALRAGGEVIADAARDRVSVRSGALRDSIAVGTEMKHFGPVGRPGVVGLAGQEVQAAGMSVYIGPTSPEGFYGHFVELGTIWAPAHPFMRPALDEAGGEAVTVIGRVIAQELQLQDVA